MVLSLTRSALEPSMTDLLTSVPSDTHQYSTPVCGRHQQGNPFQKASKPSRTCAVRKAILQARKDSPKNTWNHLNLAPAHLQSR